MNATPTFSQLTGKRGRTRLALVDAVRKLIETAGDFTANQIAKQAGSSPATFYNHFESKEDAFDQAFAMLMDELVELVEDGLDIETVLEIGLEEFAAQWVLGCVQFFRENQVLFRSALARLPASAALEAAYHQSEQRAIGHCARFIRLGQAAKLMRDGDAEQMAQAMMVTAEGYINPAILRINASDALHRELTRSVLLHLRAQ